MALTPFGATCTLPQVATAPCRSAAARAASTTRAKASIGSSRSTRRVVPAWSARPARSSRQRPCGWIAVPTAIARPRSASARPCSTCSSTNVPIRPSASGSGAERGVPRPRDGLGHRHAVGVGEPGGPLGGERAGEDARARARHPEPGALLVAEAGHAERARRAEPVRAQHVERGERADDAERAVERAAVGHGVQVGAGDDAGPIRVGIAPPGDEVARPVGRDVQPPGLGLAREPVPQLGVLPGPGEPPVPARAGASEVSEVGQPGPRIGGMSPRCDWVGAVSPRCKPAVASLTLPPSGCARPGPPRWCGPRRSPRRRAAARPSPGRSSARGRASPPRAGCRRPR